MLSAILSVLLLLDAPASAELSGKVIAPDGTPVKNATVLVYTAAPKKGIPTTNASEFPECSKSALSDSAGAFIINPVDPTLTYELLVVSDTYRPLLLRKVDPLRGQITAKLKTLPADVDAELIVRGRMVDGKGDPVVGAKIEPCSYGSGNSRTYGGESSVIETVTYTNAKGEFTLVAKQAGLDFDMQAHHKHAAPMIIRHLHGGAEQPPEFATTPGAKITGRVIKDGKGLPGVKLNLVQQNRLSQDFLGIQAVRTNEDGRFTFVNAHPETAYDLSTTTQSLNGRGTVAPIRCQTQEDEATTDVGELAVEAGHALSGQLVVSSGSAPFEDAKVRLESGETWDDGLEISMDKDGKFAFKGVGTGAYQLSVKLDDFHLSKENTSADPYGARFLLGRVEDDITDLKVQLDPGPAERGGSFNQAAWQALQSARMSGVESK